MNLQATDKLNETIMVLSGLRDTTLAVMESPSEVTSGQLVLFHRVLESCVGNLQEVKREVSNETR